MSQTLAEASHAPDTKMFWLGPSDRLWTRGRQYAVHEVERSSSSSPHDIPRVVVELDDPDSSIDVPEHARHVPRARQDLPVVQEAAAREVARVRAQLPRDLDVPLFGAEIVDGADVVQSSAGDKVPRGGVRAGHDPGRAERDRVHLVRRVGVPDDELPVLRGRDEVPLVLRPVHGVDLGEVALEGTSRTHGDPRQGVNFRRHRSH
jgi:hypothetical protein